MTPPFRDVFIINKTPAKSNSSPLQFAIATITSARVFALGRQRIAVRIAVRRTEGISRRHGDAPKTLTVFLLIPNPFSQ
jgi:hypothetical protein